MEAVEERWRSAPPTAGQGDLRHVSLQEPAHDGPPSHSMATGGTRCLGLFGDDGQRGRDASAWRLPFGRRHGRVQERGHLVDKGADAGGVGDVVRHRNRLPAAASAMAICAQASKPGLSTSSRGGIEP